jgi:hypothetical protein
MQSPPSNSIAAPGRSTRTASDSEPDGHIHHIFYFAEDKMITV